MDMLKNMVETLGKQIGHCEKKYINTAKRHCHFLKADT